MNNTLADIRQKLQDRVYCNEEHVRLAIVARILQKLGWNIWDPTEVNAEYKPVPNEDATRVDFALFSSSRDPSVFIEVKAVGRMDDLASIERQLRDYNRDNTALFCVATDGSKWQFYYPQTGGKFSKKCFKIINIMEDDLEDVELALMLFLSKDEIDSGQAESEAKGLLKLTQIEVAMEEHLPEARRQSQLPPFPSVPDALVALVVEDGFPDISREKAVQFITKPGSKLPPGPGPRPPESPKPDGRGRAMELPVDRPPDLRFTKFEDARIGNRKARNWNSLVTAGIQIAVERGHGISDLRGWLAAQVAEGEVTDRGFRPVTATNVSFQNVPASIAWKNALALARALKCEIAVDFHWRDREGAAHPGERGVLHWSP